MLHQKDKNIVLYSSMYICIILKSWLFKNKTAPAGNYQAETVELVFVLIAGCEKSDRSEKHCSYSAITWPVIHKTSARIIVTKIAGKLK